MPGKCNCGRPGGCLSCFTSDIELAILERSGLLPDKELERAQASRQKRIDELTARVRELESTNKPLGPPPVVAIDLQCPECGNRLDGYRECRVCWIRRHLLESQQ